MPNLLIVANCPSPNTRKLQQAARDGAATNPAVQTRAPDPLAATADDVLWADAVLLGTTENFGYMSGLMKDFLERIYYPCLAETEGMPAAVYVKGGLDGQGAKAAVEKILVGLKWRLVQPTLVMKGDFCGEFEGQCRELGEVMAAGLEVGVF